MFKTFKRINARYDEIREPYKFFWFFGLILVSALLAHFSPVLGLGLIGALVVFRMIGRYS